MSYVFMLQDTELYIYIHRYKAICKFIYIQIYIILFQYVFIYLHIFFPQASSAAVAKAFFKGAKFIGAS